jgi:hypothetical protein
MRFILLLILLLLVIGALPTLAVQRRLGILSQWLGLGSADCALDNSSSIVTATITQH